jgi:group I intron endonuclease
MFYIYKITNKINGKIYIGKTKNVKSRWQKHIWVANNKKYNRPLHNNIRKYGSQNFNIEIIDSYELEIDAFMAETKHILDYQSNDLTKGMNLTAGGEGPSGMKHSNKTKEHLSIVCSGWSQSEEAKQKIGQAHKGKIVSKETREKLKAANLGKILSEETRNKLSKIKQTSTLGENNGFYGKTHSQETKNTLSEKMSGENSPRAIFTNEQVREIRNDYATDQYTLKELSEKYKATISCIHGIVLGKRYKNVI